MSRRWMTKIPDEIKAVLMDAFRRGFTLLVLARNDADLMHAHLRDHRVDLREIDECRHERLEALRVRVNAVFQFREIPLDAARELVDLRSSGQNTCVPGGAGFPACR